ncbi:MAG TPA: LLM class flavin-dependent oxidoreductase [Blastocatellia bacterium]|nr:LLM class flavin-dependent oxidoreductase [Blastocatellia bacterium]
MKYAVVIQSQDFKSYGNIAKEAEEAGWDAVFIADAISVGFEGQAPFSWFDPWVVLAVMAERTQHIKLGTMIAAVPRRRPWKLAREVCTLDHISNGRIILGVGLGAGEDGGFCKVGEPTDLKTRGELLDEGLQIIGGLWTGKSFSFKGDHYTVDALTLLPPPVQAPRVPIWVVGVWPKEKSMRRTLRWDGVIPQKYGASSTVKPEDIREIKEYVDARLNGDAGETQGSEFDIIAGGETPGEDPTRSLDIIRPFAEAGATWWVESSWASEDPEDGLNSKKTLARIRQGPPPSVQL